MEEEVSRGPEHVKLHVFLESEILSNLEDKDAIPEFPKCLQVIRDERRAQQHSLWHLHLSLSNQGVTLKENHKGVEGLAYSTVSPTWIPTQLTSPAALGAPAPTSEKWEF